MKKMLTIKTGSPLRLTVFYYESDGTTPKDLPPIIDLDVIDPHDPGTPLANLSVGAGITIAGDLKSFDVFHNDTSAWPIKKIEVDILYDKGETTQRPTESFYLTVLEGITT